MASEYFGEFTSTIVVTVGALVVGATTKLITARVDRKKDNLSEHLALRKELREELDSVKEEIYRLQRELDDWREKYYQQLEVNTVLQAELASLKFELEEYKSKSDEHRSPFSKIDLHPADE
jgi:chromosome segregation ATPase